jgi:nucleoside-diphosphate-sugar epimerase
MQDTFLITGATGFVGSCIARELVSQKKRVCVIVRNKKLNWRLSDIASNLDIYECDLLSRSLKTLVSKIKPDFIFHLASYGALSSQNSFDQMIDIDIKGTVNLLHAIKKNRFKLCINTGSSSEYGINNKKMKESDRLAPINDYGIAKASATLFCQKEAVRNNLPIITYRLFSPYGYYEEKNRLVSSTILSVLHDEPITLSSPANVRDFIFIEDVVRAYLQILQTKIIPGDIFNIGSGEEHSIQDLVEEVVRIAKSKSQIRWGVIGGQQRQIEPKKWEADISKTKKILGWRPKHNLHSGLKKTIEWFNKHSYLYEK